MSFEIGQRVKLRDYIPNDQLLSWFGDNDVAVRSLQLLKKFEYPIYVRDVMEVGRHTFLALNYEASGKQWCFSYNVPPHFLQAASVNEVTLEVDDV